MLAFLCENLRPQHTNTHTPHPDAWDEITHTEGANFSRATVDASGKTDYPFP